MKLNPLPTKTILFGIGIILLALLHGCGGGGTRGNTLGEDDGGTPATPTAESLVRTLFLTSTTSKVKSDNSNKAILTIEAKDQNNGPVEGATVVVATDTGFISASSVETDAQGRATIEFSSGQDDPSTRTATVEASVNSLTKQKPILIEGSDIVLAATGTTLPDDGSSSGNLTVTLRDAGGNLVQGTSVTAASSGGGRVNIATSPATSNANGQVTFSVTGAVSGSATVTVSALGLTRTQAYTVSPTATAFKIDEVNGAAVPASHVVASQLGSLVTVRANAPTASNVVFATSLGVWQNNGLSSVTIPVTAGKATATLNATTSGLAMVQILDPANAVQTDSVTIAVTAVTANRISVQANPTAISRSLGATLATSTVVATVRDASGNPVGGVPVAFLIVNPTGGGETVSPVVGISASTPTADLGLGQVKTTFTSGSVPSSQQGIQIRAAVVGANVTTGSGTTPPTASSGTDASIVIGGTAASVSIGQPSSFTDTPSTYIYPMSVVVSDANGNAAASQTVNLSVFPIAFNTGGACSVDSDANGDDPATTAVIETNVFKGWFFSEDFNENFNRDSGEDGRREFYRNGVRGTFASAGFSAAQGGGNPNNQLTAESAAAGTLPATATTDAQGVANFNLVYNKTSAFHIVARVRASTIVQGTEAVGELKFILPALKKDADPDCFLPASPWQF